MLPAIGFGFDYMTYIGFIKRHLDFDPGATPMLPALFLPHGDFTRKRITHNH